MLPSFIKPMLAVEVHEPFDSDHHLFEIKWDGIRCLAMVERGRVRLQSRELIDISSQFPELGCLEQLPDGTVVDGELVVMDGNRPSLGRIQRRAQLQDQHRIGILSQSTPVVYVIFDLVCLHGQSIMARPLLDRRRELERIVSDLGVNQIILSQAVIGQGRELFRAVEKLGLEGIMAKSLDGQYRPGSRTGLWKKIKLERMRATPTGAVNQSPRPRGPE